MEAQICSEVNTFSKQLELDTNCAEGTRLAEFVFSCPKLLEQRSEQFFCKQDLEWSGVRRSRSNPVLDTCDESDEDIEVPRFSSLDHEDQYGEDVEVDSDGDLSVPRVGESVRDLSLVVEHWLTTGLGQVGLQVWRGSLLLADYLLHLNTQMDGRRVLEVGSGTALASIVASMCGCRVTATDIHNEQILGLMKRNVERNKSCLQGNIDVKALNFKDQLEILNYLEDIEIVLAGDVIYDDNITMSFIEFMVGLRRKAASSSLKFLVSLEKRFVFTVSDLDTVAPAHDFFISQLELLQAKCGENTVVSINHLDIEFEQFFCYDRSNEMVLIEVVVEQL